MSIVWATALLAIVAGGAVAAVWAVVNPSWITRPRRGKNLARRLARQRDRQ